MLSKGNEISFYLLHTLKVYLSKSCFKTARQKTYVHLEIEFNFKNLKISAYGSGYHGGKGLFSRHFTTQAVEDLEIPDWWGFKH